jgi:hypothetical protein
MVRRLASQLAQEELGYHWVDRFVQRYPDLLKRKLVTTMDHNRHRADSERKYKLYFELLRDKLDQYRVEPRHIYNMDEKGFMIGLQSRSKRIFSRASLESGIRGSLIQEGNREWITLIACICADGSYLDPSLIYQGQPGSIQNSWLQGFDPNIYRARIISSPSGWSNNDIGLQWLKQVFDPATKAKARSSYRLLFMDGHQSHLTMDIIDYCDQNKVLLAIFPPHATHNLQPLDVALFKPLSAAAIQAREESKLIRAREMNERRQARAEARLLREKQRADEAAERAARQAARKAAQRLQQAINTSQKVKKKSFKARTKPTPKTSIVGDRGGGAHPSTCLTSPPPIRSRRGRDIKLPAKYK